jgi:hypothetical protein
LTVKRHPFIDALALSIALVLPGVATAAQQAGPVFETAPTPPTLGDLIDQSRLVIYGRVVKVGSPEVQGAKNWERVRRMQEVEIVDVLKGPSTLRPGTRLTVRQTGGTASAKGTEIATAYSMRLLEVGDQVLLFLLPAPGTTGAYDIAFEKSGALWRRDDGTTDLPPDVGKMPELSQKQRPPLSEVLATIRRHPKG